MSPLATLVGKDSLKHASAKGKINMKKIINVRSIIRMANKDCLTLSQDYVS
jgi:hypothetical protein